MKLGWQMYKMKIIMSYLQEDEKLKECLASLKKYSPEIEVILLHSDPKKTKSAEDAIQKWIEKNGMDDDLMQWHPDMRATDGWYSDLMQYYDEFDVIGCKLLYPDGTVQHYGGMFRPDGIGFHPHQYVLNINLVKPTSCAFVTGPSMIIKKHVYEKLKGWDHTFWSYIDAEFCVRALKEGFTVGVVPVELIHSEGEDIHKQMDIPTRNKFLNEGVKRFTTKHMDFLSKYK